MRLNTHTSYIAAVDPALGTVRTPLILKAWGEKLQKHPDKDYVRYILE